MELTLQSLTKSFGPKTVLRDLSLTAGLGMCVGVLGRNGAGKSTLFNLLTNVLLPSSGQILIDGEAMGETFPVAVKRRMGALGCAFDGRLAAELRLFAGDPAQSACRHEGKRLVEWPGRKAVVDAVCSGIVHHLAGADKRHIHLQQARRPRACIRRSIPNASDQSSHLR